MSNDEFMSIFRCKRCNYLYIDEEQEKPFSEVGIKLVKLELSEKEIENLQDQLTDTIDYIKNLSELDTEGILGQSYNTEAKKANPTVRPFLTLEV